MPQPSNPQELTAEQTHELVLAAVQGGSYKDIMVALGRGSTKTPHQIKDNDPVFLDMLKVERDSRQLEKAASMPNAELSSALTNVRASLDELGKSKNAWYNDFNNLYHNLSAQASSLTTSNDNTTLQINQFLKDKNSLFLEIIKDKLSGNKTDAQLLEKLNMLKNHYQELNSKWENAKNHAEELTHKLDSLHSQVYEAIVPTERKTVPVPPHLEGGGGQRLG